MRLRTVFANVLAEGHFPQFANHPRAEYQRDGESRQARQRRARRDVLKHAKRRNVAVEHLE